MLFPNQDRPHLASYKLPSAARMMTYFNAKTVLAVFTSGTFAMRLRIAQTGAMRAPMLAKMSVRQFALRVILSSHATTAVAYG